MKLKKNVLVLLLVCLAISALVSSCGGNQDTDVAVIVALTQTAAALQQPASAPVLEPTATSTAADLAPAATQPLPTATLPPVAAKGYQPLDPTSCEALNSALIGSLGISGSWEYPVPFTDYIKGESGSGCQVTFSTTGASVSNYMDGLYKPAQATLQGLGWVEDVNYGAGGPLGMSTGYRKDNVLCLLSAKGEPVDRALCPSDQPIGSCWEKLTPDQQILTLTLNCSAYNP